MEDDKSDPISIEFEGHPDSRLVLKNFDPTRWSQVETSDDDTAWKVILTGAGSLILLSGYGAENDPSDFPFDERGLPWIEKYLDTLVKPYVRKWGKEEGGLEVLKVRNKHGMDKHGVETRFAIAAFVLLQCLAQQHGKLIAKDGFASFRLEDGSGAMGKVRKYVKFGYEDSLVIYSKVIGNLSKTEVFVKSVEYLMAKRGLTNHRVQLWNDERGLPVMAKAVDNDTDEVAFCVQNTFIDKDGVASFTWPEGASISGDIPADFEKPLPDEVAQAVRNALVREGRIGTLN